ncbi:MAG: hypothetical protein JWP36_2336 [Paucimonas sp.]|nr:hypothetical protein [Paucimonas sp.]
MSTVRTVELQRGFAFIGGLFWQPLPGVSPAQRKRELQRIAKEQAFDLMVLPNTEIAQVGYASEAEGAHQGVVSIAAAFAHSAQAQGLQRSLLFAGPIDNDNWYYYAQRDGLILFNGDRIGSEDEVRALLQADLEATEWDAVFAPAAWAVRGSNERPLADFLPANSRLQYRRSRRVRPVKTRMRDLLVYWRWGAGVLVVGLLVTGVAQWRSIEAARQLAAYAAQQRELAALREADAARVVHAWKAQPRATTFAKACADTQDKIVTLWPGGWTFNGMNCANGALTVTWGRAPGGWIEHLHAAHPEVQVDATGDVAKLVLRLPALAGEDEAVSNERVRLNQLHQAAQRFGYPLKTSASVAPQAQGKAGAPGQAPAQGQTPGKDGAKTGYDWREVPWSLDYSMLPALEAVRALDGNGFRITSIDTRYANGVMSWSMKGTQYVRN